MSKWICKGDKVLVIAGNDKGKTGEVLAKREERVLVQGINIRKRHVKKSQATQNAQIISVESPINISNVALCNKEGQKIKVRVKQKNNKNDELFFLEKGKEVILKSLKNKKKKKKGK